MIVAVVKLQLGKIVIHFLVSLSLGMASICFLTCPKTASIPVMLPASTDGIRVRGRGTEEGVWERRVEQSI